MKKGLIWFLLFGLILLAGCGNSSNNLSSISKKSMNNISQVQNTESNSISKDNSIIQYDSNQTTKVEDLNSSNFADNNDSPKEVLQDEAKIKSIDSKITSVGWYKVNCKKEFKTHQGQIDCQMKQLAEAGNACTDPSFPKLARENPDAYFTKNRFDLLDEETIAFYKKKCVDQINSQKEAAKKFKQLEQEKKQKEEKLAKLKQELDQKIKNFKISDCEKLAKTINSTDKHDFIERCEIGYVLNYKNGNCSLLKSYGLEDKCKEAKRLIDLYKKMRDYNSKYGNFNLTPLLAPKELLYGQLDMMGPLGPDMGGF